MIKQRTLSGIYSCDFRTLEGKRVRKSLHTTDRREAKKREAKLIREAKADSRRREADIKLCEAFHHALRVRDEWRSAKRLDSVRQVYKSVEDHFGANRPLSQIDSEAILKLGEKLRRKGNTASTINKRLSVMSVLFDEAIEWGKYRGEKPRMVRHRVRNARRRLITPAEESKAISLCIQSSPYESAMADLIVVLADTGLRLSEALGIQPEHINIEAEAVMVVDTKSGDDRVVPLTGRALEILKRRNVAPVFQPLNAYVVSHIWRRIRKKMGLEHDKEFVLHSFRHTYGSILANAGTDAFRLQKAMGHKNIQSTQRYIKVSAAALKGLSSIMEQRTAKYQKEVSARPPSTDTP
jgi:integrase